jgi:tRNA(fMet)-specific endonuclease VapC
VFVLDTNTLIHFFKSAGRVADKLLTVAPREVAIPAVALYELEVGVASSKPEGRRRKQLDTFVAAISVLPFDRRSAKAAAELRLTLEHLGKGIGPLDTLIAGTVLAHGGVLVTHNTDEFRRVPGLRVVDWF